MRLPKSATAGKYEIIEVMLTGVQRLRRKQSEIVDRGVLSLQRVIT